ncbi:MAG: hypothetical protein JWM47_4428 [Acidimicrobiales bacterium]|nr:hypothetical protein [Acidimicrobiales bacterium]
MSRRCSVGRRARIIAGSNISRVVVVVRHYFHGEEVSGSVWPLAILPWVVTSLSCPLRNFDVDTGKEELPKMTMVYGDRDLEPLEDDAVDSLTQARVNLKLLD